jgi:hypothetical protein
MRAAALYRQGMKDFAALAALLIVGLGAVRAQSDEPPAAGRPEDFSGLVGTYEIESHASPTEVQVLESLTLTVTITETSSKGPPRLAPQHVDLHLFPPSLTRDFYVEAVPDKPRPDARSREFSYRLKPKSSAVQRIPALKLTYYDPRYGRYQVAYSRSILITVKSSGLAQASPPEQSVRAPEHVYQLVTGPAVLARKEHSPAWPALTLLLLGPPAVCAAWYVLWKRIRPDDARQARWRRSRAARSALRQLHALRPASGVEAAALVAEYLRQRLNLTVAEPTPEEAWLSLRRARVSPAVSAKVREFFRACDASRFAPAVQRDGQHLATEAQDIIHAVEAEPCLSRHSC